MSQNTNLARACGGQFHVEKISSLIKVELLVQGIHKSLDIVQYYAEVQYDKLSKLFPITFKILDPSLQAVNDKRTAAKQHRYDNSSPFWCFQTYWKIFKKS